MIFNEDMVGGLERVTTARGAGTARGLNKDQIVKIARLTGCKNFVGKRSLRWEGFVEKVGFEPGVKE